ncbi:MAG TPA: ATP-binding protein [Acidimicrobiales bacterium]
MTDARASFPPTLTSATDARHFAERVLDRWGLEDLRDTVRLLVSELVINAVLHAGTTITLCLRLDPDRLLVEVTDGSTSPPVLRVPGPSAPTGRGLQILASLSDEWGVDSLPVGKTVWFALASTPVAGRGDRGSLGESEVLDPSEQGR